MRITFIVLTFAIASVITICACDAQITMTNSASGGPATATTTGTAHSYDTTTASVAPALWSTLNRTPASGTDHLPTGAALDPATNGNGGASADNGITIQWWYKPAAATAFGYHWSDRAWGSFRCFQNGAAGVGEVIIRGPLTQLATTGSVLVNNLNAAGWIHLAVVVNGTKGTITWYVNGKLNNSGTTAAFTTAGTAFLCFGDAASSSGYDGNADDMRIYDWARTAGDVAADYMLRASGNGPSGSPNLPDLGYYMCEPLFTCAAPATLAVGSSGPIDLSNGPATAPYQIAAAFGATGNINLGLCSVNLDFDPLFAYSVSIGVPIFNGYGGFLAAGAAQGKFAVPAISALVGTTVYHAAITYDKYGAFSCTPTVKTGLVK